jgi:hypothetical protein
VPASAAEASGHCDSTVLHTALSPDLRQWLTDRRGFLPYSVVVKFTGSDSISVAYQPVSICQRCLVPACVQVGTPVEFTVTSNNIVAPERLEFVDATSDPGTTLAAGTPGAASITSTVSRSSQSSGHFLGRQVVPASGTSYPTSPFSVNWVAPTITLTSPTGTANIQAGTRSIIQFGTKVWAAEVCSAALAKTQRNALLLCLSP